MQRQIPHAAGIDRFALFVTKRVTRSIRRDGLERDTDIPTKVTRADGSIKLNSGFFQVNYAGTFVGSDFSATGEIPLEGNAPVPCPGGTVQQLPGVSSLSGRFSSDDRVLTATETNTYPLASGGTVVYKWEWQAARR